MCTFAHVIEVLSQKQKVTKRAEIRVRISALNFYITKMFTGQQYKSISSGERTKEDWEEFRLYKRSLSTDTVVESALEEAITSDDNKNNVNKKRGRPRMKGV